MSTKPLALNLRRLKPAARLVALNDWVTEHACDYPIVTHSGAVYQPGPVRYRDPGYVSNHWCISDTFPCDPMPPKFKKRFWLPGSFEMARWSTSLDAVWPLAVKAFHHHIVWRPDEHELVTWGRGAAVFSEHRFSTLPEALCVALLRRRGVEVVL